LLTVADGPVELVIDDVNADGNLDIVAAGNRSGDGTFSVLLGNGDGTFAASIDTVSNFSPATLDLGDLNGDNIPDIVIGNASFSFSNRVEARFGNGDGTFDAPTTYAFGGAGFFPGAPQQIKLADVDNDGNLDVVGVDSTTNSARVLLGRSNGTFEGVVAYDVGSNPESLDVGDLNGDGWLDLIVANRSDGLVSLLLGNGDGTFAPAIDFSVGNAPVWVELADLDNDGDLDFVTANRDDDTISARLNSSIGGNGSTPTARLYNYDTTFSQITGIFDEEGRTILFDIDPATGNTLSMTQVIGELGGADDLVTQHRLD